MIGDFSTWVPRLSPGLNIQKFGERDYLISNQNNGFNLKVNSNTFAMLSEVDGEKNIAQIAQQLQVQIHPDLNPQIVFDTLYQNLGPYGIIDQETFELKEKRKPLYLWLSFMVLNPKLTNRIAQFFAPLFFQNLLLPLLLFAFGVLAWGMIAYWGNPNLGITQLSTSQYLLFPLLLGASKFFHEFGHAAASKFYGVDSKGIGFGFYLLLPVTFADVSGIWRLSARQRMVVNVGGMYFEVLLCGFLTLFFHLFAWPQLIIIPLLISFSILINFNPFTRLDGYWIISDWTNTPNLMREGQARISTCWRALRAGTWPSTFQRKDYGLLLYGVLSQLVIIAILSYILLKDVNAIVSFPVEVWHLLGSVWDTPASGWSELSERGSRLFLPFLFYFILLRKSLVYLWIKRRSKRG